jgi:hypothetical protein
MAKAQKKGIIHQFNTMGAVFTKWTTDLETFEHAPECLDAFLVEVRKRRSYHGCIAAFEEMILSRLEDAKTKENARRHEFQTRFSAHMPSEFRQMLLDPVPSIRIDKRLRACGWDCFEPFFSCFFMRSLTHCCFIVSIFNSFNRCCFFIVHSLFVQQHPSAGLR